MERERDIPYGWRAVEHGGAGDGGDRSFTVGSDFEVGDEFLSSGGVVGAGDRGWGWLGGGDHDSEREREMSREGESRFVMGGGF